MAVIFRRVLSTISIFGFILGFQSQALAESAESARERLMIEDAYEAAPGRLFNEAEYLAGTSILNQYTNVIVVNKSAKGPEAQVLKFYRDGQFIMATKVSTGKEDLEYVSAVAGFFRKFGKGSVESHWRHTTRGFYIMKSVKEYEYRSGESRFHMPYAMFFNDKRGLAIHQVPPDLKGGERAGERYLGRRASGGCVRVHKDHIRQIHDMVLQAGIGQVPVLDTRTGLAMTDAAGNVLYKQGFRTMVIVEETHL